MLAKFLLLIQSQFGLGPLPIYPDNPNEAPSGYRGTHNLKLLRCLAAPVPVDKQLLEEK